MSEFPVFCLERWLSLGSQHASPFQAPLPAPHAGRRSQSNLLLRPRNADTPCLTTPFLVQ